MKKIFLNWTISILTGMFSLFMLSVLGFVLGLPINKFYLILSSIISILTLAYLSFKVEGLSVKNFIAQIIVLVDFLIIFGVICYLIPDFSFDGRTYHQACMIWLKWGWNPVYHNLYLFASNMPYFMPSSIENSQHFVKFYEIVGANIYNCFGDIEFTKITNFLLMVVGFCYSYYSISNFKNISKLQNCILSFLIIYNPVCICQMLTNYVDCAFYYLFLVFIFAFINYVKKEDVDISLFLMIITSVMFANVKLTGLFLSIIIFAICLKFYRSKKLLVSVLISLLIILFAGINPYLTNILDGKNPFYPIIKESVVDANREYLITSYPNGFENKNRFEKLFISLFSVSKNISPLINSEEKPKLKIPFTIGDADKFKYEDMRVGGFGHFFSGILILSLILFVFLRFRNKKDKKLFWCVMSIFIISILGNHESWWARFVPQMWLLPLIILLFWIDSSKILYRNKLVLTIFTFFILINCISINYEYLSSRIQYSKEQNAILNDAKNFNKPIIFEKGSLENNKILETYPIKLKDRNIPFIIE